MSKNKVKLNICGCEFAISSDDSESYVRSISDEVGKSMEETMESNERISLTMAAVITALRFCDESHKSTSGADNLRSQIKDYLEDSSRARTETEDAKHEIERLKQEIEELHTQLSKNNETAQEKEDKPEKAETEPIEKTQDAVSKIISSGSSVEKPQEGSFARVEPKIDNLDDPDGFMSFFEKKND